MPSFIFLIEVFSLTEISCVTLKCLNEKLILCLFLIEIRFKSKKCKEKK